MRDEVITKIYQAAKLDPTIIFLSADFGAPALDAFRQELPQQFINVGIAEQNMIDVAAGLALEGRKVFCYAMAPFITARCLEQIKASLAIQALPVILIGVGVGLGYDVASMTHIAVDDLVLMRSINNLDILTPSDPQMATVMATDILSNPRLSYLRLDRQQFRNPGTLEADDARALAQGFRIVQEGYDAMIVGCGASIHTAYDAANQLANPNDDFAGANIAVLEVLRHAPNPNPGLLEVLSSVPTVYCVEEQLVQGGTGSYLLDLACERDNSLPFQLYNFGVQNGFRVRNGTRAQLQQDFGIDVSTVVKTIRRGFIQ